MIGVPPTPVQWRSRARRAGSKCSARRCAPCGGTRCSQLTHGASQSPLPPPPPPMPPLMPLMPPLPLGTRRARRSAPETREMLMQICSDTVLRLNLDLVNIYMVYTWYARRINTENAECAALTRAPDYTCILGCVARGCRGAGGPHSLRSHEFSHRRRGPRDVRRPDGRATCDDPARCPISSTRRVPDSRTRRRARERDIVRVESQVVP